jgi:hypothetical protein
LWKKTKILEQKHISIKLSTVYQENSTIQKMSQPTDPFGSGFHDSQFHLEPLVE